MDRKDLKEIIELVIKRAMAEKNTPRLACIFGDSCDSCDVTTKYGLNEEA